MSESVSRNRLCRKRKWHLIRSIQNESAGDATSTVPPMTFGAGMEPFEPSIRWNSSVKTGWRGNSIQAVNQGLRLQSLSMRNCAHSLRSGRRRRPCRHKAERGANQRLITERTGNLSHRTFKIVRIRDIP